MATLAQRLTKQFKNFFLGQNGTQTANEQYTENSENPHTTDIYESIPNHIAFASRPLPDIPDPKASNTDQTQTDAGGGIDNPIYGFVTPYKPNIPIQTTSHRPLPDIPDQTQTDAGGEIDNPIYDFVTPYKPKIPIQTTSHHPLPDIPDQTQTDAGGGIDNPIYDFVTHYKPKIPIQTTSHHPLPDIPDQTQTDAGWIDNPLYDSVQHILNPAAHETESSIPSTESTKIPTTSEKPVTEDDVTEANSVTLEEDKDGYIKVNQPTNTQDHNPYLKLLPRTPEQSGDGYMTVTNHTTSTQDHNPYQQLLPRIPEQSGDGYMTVTNHTTSTQDHNPYQQLLPRIPEQSGDGYMTVTNPAESPIDLNITTYEPLPEQDTYTYEDMTAAKVTTTSEKPVREDVDNPYSYVRIKPSTASKPVDVNPPTSTKDPKPYLQFLPQTHKQGDDGYTTVTNPAESPIDLNITTYEPLPEQDTYTYEDMTAAKVTTTSEKPVREDVDNPYSYVRIKPSTASKPVDVNPPTSTKDPKPYLQFLPQTHKQGDDGYTTVTNPAESPIDLNITTYEPLPEQDTYTYEDMTAAKVTTTSEKPVREDVDNPYSYVRVRIKHSTASKHVDVNPPTSTKDPKPYLQFLPQTHKQDNDGYTTVTNPAENQGNFNRTNVMMQVSPLPKRPLPKASSTDQTNAGEVENPLYDSVQQLNPAHETESSIPSTKIPTTSEKPVTEDVDNPYSYVRVRIKPSIAVNPPTSTQDPKPYLQFLPQTHKQSGDEYIKMTPDSTMYQKLLDKKLLQEIEEILPTIEEILPTIEEILPDVEVEKTAPQNSLSSNAPGESLTSRSSVK